MKKALRIITIILLISFIPIISFGVYVLFFKTYSGSGLFPGLESLGDIILFIILLLINFVLLIITRLISSIYDYRKNKNKKLKTKVIIFSSILILILSIILYYPVKDFLTRTTLVPVEPLTSEIIELVKNEEWLSIMINENDYDIEILEKVSEEPEYGFFRYSARIKETDELILVTVKKYYSRNRITRLKIKDVLVLMNIEEAN